MFSALLDQIQSNPVLQNYAESHWELRWKVVSEGYETLLKTGVLSWPDDPMTGTPTEYGDEVVLNLVANICCGYLYNTSIQGVLHPPEPGSHNHQMYERHCP